MKGVSPVVLMVYLEQPLAYHERYVAGGVDGLFRTTIVLSRKVCHWLC